MAPDSSAVLDVLRKGASLTLSARLGKRPDYAEPAAGRPAGRAQEEESPPEEEPAALSWEGAVFEPSREGVRVSRIEPSSALQGTLKPGDLIRGVDESEVSSIEELRRALAGASLRKGVLLDVLRRGRPMYLSIKG
jgi:serine protease Do